ncbi:hypothetical protein DFH29DRAFT_1039264 [Suillus ampliporus]|nr:hypothetical protein DFH29DRAFT_1039264 [Suillus ampliporus]
MRIGYSYIPNVNGQPMILDWSADEHVGFSAIGNTHMKIAYVQEHTDVGPQHYSVYLNTGLYPGMSLGQFMVPNGWKAVGVHSHDNGSALMIIEKVADPENRVYDFFHNIPHGNMLFDPVVQHPAPVNPVVGYAALSPAGTSFTPDSASLFGNSDIFSTGENDWMDHAPYSAAASSVALVLPPYDPPFINTQPSLLPHGSVIGMQRLPAFVGYNQEVFEEGIVYKPTYLKAIFPAAWTIISNARLKAKNYLTVSPGSKAVFKSYCVQAITEMQTISSASPQPAELGLQCRKTSRTKLLDILDEAIIEMLYLERGAFLKSMKACAQSFIEEPKKAYLGGFALKSKTLEEAKEIIQRLTKMTDCRSNVASIAFTFDDHNKKKLEEEAAEKEKEKPVDTRRNTLSPQVESGDRRVFGPTADVHLLHSQPIISSRIYKSYDQCYHHTWEISKNGNGVISVQNLPEEEKQVSHPKPIDLWIEPEVVQNLLNAYFKEIAPLLPVVSQAEFLANPSPSPILLYSMCLVAAARREVPQSVFDSIRYAVNGVIKAEDSFPVRPKRSFSTLDSVGYSNMNDLGLHRAESVKQSVELRRRLWGACVICDRWTSLTYGHPYMIDVQDCDARLPSSGDPNDLYMDELIRPSVILGRVLKTIYSPSGLMFATDETLYNLLSDLESWKTHLPENLQYRGSNTPQDAGLLHLLYCSVCMIFWRVFMRISYACPAHLKFGLTVETWSSLVQLTSESID